MADAAQLEPEQLLDPASLARYADLLAVTCLSLEHDDTLFLTAHPEQRQLVVALAEAGYRAGARLVDIAYEEPRAAAARVRYATDEHLGLLPDWQARRLRASKGSDRASLFVVGEADPGVFDGLAPERVAADVARRMQKIRDVALASLDGRIRWTGCAWPTDHWAGQVYTGLDTMEAKRRLAEDILWFCRLGPGDPVDGSGWVAHATMLARTGADPHRARAEAAALPRPRHRPRGGPLAGNRLRRRPPERRLRPRHLRATCRPRSATRAPRRAPPPARSTARCPSPFAAG